MRVGTYGAALAVLAGALLLIILIAAAEAALATISRTRLKSLSEQGVSGAGLALHLVEDMPRVRLSFSLLNTLLFTILLGAALVVAEHLGYAVWRMLLATLVGTLLLQTVSAGVGARWYQWTAPMMAPVVHLLHLAMTPLRQALSGLSRRLAGSPELEDEEALRLGEEELRVLASVVGEEEAEIAEEGREMIYSIVTLAQTTVREVMVPRPDIVALRSDISMLDALDLIIREGHSRIPVYEEKIDNIVGVLYVKDLLAYLRDGRTDVPIRDILRPALFVPSSKRADELLQDLQGRRVHMAIVFDEYGGTAGLVTIEDILEEIVGEIQDEYDFEDEPFVLVNEFEAIVSGLLDIDDLNHEMDLELPTDENDTVGGLIYSALGRIPLVGDEVRMEEAGVTFRVLVMAGRRISTVRVQVDRPEPELPDQGGSSPNGATERPPAAEDGPEADLSRLLFR